MRRLAALGALGALSLLAGCATGGSYYSGAYGYDYGGYPAYAYDYGYAPYDNYGYPYGYGSALGLGFAFHDYDGSHGGSRYRDGRRWSGSNRPSNLPAGGLGPQAVGPQARSGGAAVAPSGGRATSMGRRRG